MRDRRTPRFSLKGAIWLFSVILVLAVTLTVLWNVVLAHDLRRLSALASESGTFHWTLILLGSALFLAVIVLLTILAIKLFSNILWGQRQSNFLASVTHELNSPLSSIKLFTQTLRKDDLTSAERTNFVRKILLDIDRLRHIIANILRAAEVDNRGEELRVVTEELDFRDYLAQYVEDVQAQYAEKLDLSLDAPEPVWVGMDRITFRQVLDNLLDNAIRYRRGNRATVELRLSEGEGHALLEVVDQGMGIPKKELSKIFERFYRLAEQEGPETGRKGMGIGLNVVRSIMLSHGGSVEARSSGPGRGAVIRLRLPALERVEVPA